MAQKISKFDMTADEKSHNEKAAITVHTNNWHQVFQKYIAPQILLFF